MGGVIERFHNLATTIHRLEDGGGGSLVQGHLEDLLSRLQALDQQMADQPTVLIPTDLLAAIDQGRHPDHHWFLQDQLEDPERGLFAAHQRALGRASAFRQFRRQILQGTTSGGDQSYDIDGDGDGVNSSGNTITTITSNGNGDDNNQSTETTALLINITD